MYKDRIFQAGPMTLWEVNSDDEVFEGKNSHCHKECEIYYMIDGEAEMVVEGQKFLLAPDSLLLMPSNSFHQWKYPAGRVHRRLNLHFLPEIMNKTEQDFFKELFAEPLHFLNGSLYQLNFYFQAISDCGEMDESMQKVAVKHRIASLLTQVKFLKTRYAAKPVILDERIQRMLVYFSEHLSEKVCLDEIAHKFGVSKNLLNTTFKNSVGITIMKYINIKRLEFARQKILNGARIGEAAYMAGFEDYTTFYRSYKSYFGCPPSEMLINQLEYTTYTTIQSAKA